MRDPDIYRYLPGDPPLRASDLEARYRRTSAGPSVPDERWWNWAVAERPHPASPFGTVEVSLADHGSRALLAYVFGVATWGRGFAYEACVAALAHLRAAAGTQRVDAYVDTRNARSVRLLERLAFVRVETIRDADRFKGSSSDEYHYRRSLVTDGDHDGQAARR